MKRTAHEALDSLPGASRDGKRSASDSSGRDPALIGESVPGSTRPEVSVAYVVDSNPTTNVSSEQPYDPDAAPSSPTLPLEPDGDAAAGPRPASDYFDWEIIDFVPSPKRLRRSHRISEYTWKLLEESKE